MTAEVDDRTIFFRMNEGFYDRKYGHDVPSAVLPRCVRSGCTADRA